jgi:hypothetical protein
MGYENWQPYKAKVIGYRQGHWEGCSCADCLETYDLHNKNGSCVCNGCTAHNLVANNAFQMEKNRVVPKVATVNFCERCESMGKSNAMGTVQYIFEPSQGWTSIECCPGCIAEFMIWRNSEVFGDREKAYKHPYTEATEDEGGEIITKSNIRKLLLALESGDETDER